MLGALPPYRGAFGLLRLCTSLFFSDGRLAISYKIDVIASHPPEAAGASVELGPTAAGAPSYREIRPSARQVAQLVRFEQEDSLNYIQHPPIS